MCAAVTLFNQFIASKHFISLDVLFTYAVPDSGPGDPDLLGFQLAGQGCLGTEVWTRDVHATLE